MRVIKTQDRGLGLHMRNEEKKAKIANVRTVHATRSESAYRRRKIKRGMCHPGELPASITLYLWDRKLGA